MLDRYLPGYLKALTAVTNPQGDSRTSVINSLTGGRIYRNRVPQGTTDAAPTEYPYILVGESFDIDYGQTAGTEDMQREVGNFNVVICGRDFQSIDQIYRDVIDALKKIRNQYLPSPSAAAKTWVQCVILQSGYQFEAVPVDGDQKPYVGYCIPVKAGYDP